MTDKLFPFANGNVTVVRKRVQMTMSHLCKDICQWNSSELF